MTATGTTPGAPRFTTGIHTTEEEASADELAAAAADLTANVADLAPVLMQGTGRPIGNTGGHGGEINRPNASPRPFVATTRLLEGTPNPAVRPARAPAPSAATTMADKPGPIRHAAAPAWLVEERAAAGLAVAADIGSQTFVAILAASEI